ncbi:MAG: hypothetical protein R3C28_30240 [Pirellulaceae bacterium]
MKIVLACELSPFAENGCRRRPIRGRLHPSWLILIVPSLAVSGSFLPKSELLIKTVYSWTFLVFRKTNHREFVFRLFEDGRKGQNTGLLIRLVVTLATAENVTQDRGQLFRHDFVLFARGAVG